MNETSHLFCTANQMAGFYMECNTGLKWVNPLNGQTHSNNSSALAEELFECV